MSSAPLSYLCIAITCLVSIMAFSNDRLIERFIMNPYTVYRRKEYHRFVTSGIIHGGWMHLIFNMVTFYSFAPFVEMIFAHKYGLGMSYVYFITLYVGGIIVSSIPEYIRNKHNEHYNSLGASGGVSSVIFCVILYFPTEPLCILPSLCVPGFIMGTVYLIYSYVYAKEGKDNIGHSAHFFGAFYGIIFGAAIEPMAIPDFFRQISQWSFFN
jgi:membrane associated rhomboid family serine protease